MFYIAAAKKKSLIFISGWDTLLLSSELLQADTSGFSGSSMAIFPFLPAPASHRDREIRPEFWRSGELKWLEPECVFALGPQQSWLRRRRHENSRSETETA